MKIFHYFQILYWPNDYQLIKKIVRRLIPIIPISIPACVGCHSHCLSPLYCPLLNKKCPRKYLQIISALNESFQTWGLDHKINLRGYKMGNRLGNKKNTVKYSKYLTNIWYVFVRCSLELFDLLHKYLKVEAARLAWTKECFTDIRRNYYTFMKYNIWLLKLQELQAVAPHHTAKAMSSTRRLVTALITRRDASQACLIQLSGWLIDRSRRTFCFTVIHRSGALRLLERNRPRGRRQAPMCEKTLTSALQVTHTRMKMAW